VQVSLWQPNTALDLCLVILLRRQQASVLTGVAGLAWAVWFTAHQNRGEKTNRDMMLVPAAMTLPMCPLIASLVSIVLTCFVQVFV